METSIEKSEVTADEIRAFMTEAEETARESSPIPPPLGMDDWEREDKPKDYRLTTEDISAIAYHAVCMLDANFNTEPWKIWHHLENHMQMHYISMTNFFMNSLANPNGHESCEALHHLVMDAKLKDGWRNGKEYSEEEKTDPTLLSYRGLPPHIKSRSFLFRCVVAGLREVWKGH